MNFIAIFVLKILHFVFISLRESLNNLKHGTKMFIGAIWFLFEIDKCFHSKVMVFYISWKIPVILSLYVAFCKFLPKRQVGLCWGILQVIKVIITLKWNHLLTSKTKWFLTTRPFIWNLVLVVLSMPQEDININAKFSA